MKTKTTVSAKTATKAAAKPAKKQKQETEYNLEISAHNGHPILNFQSEVDTRFPVMLGLKKIKAVLDNLEACQAFVASEGKSLG